MTIITKKNTLVALGAAVLIVFAGCGKAAPTTTATAPAATAPAATTTPRTTATTSPVPTATPTATATTTPVASPRPTSSPAPAVTVPSGSLRVALSTWAGDNLDPVTGAGVTQGSITAPMFESLLGLDSSSRLSPSVADRWEVAPDGLSWTYYIHKGIKFHNGDDVTAADVKFSLERYLSKDAFASNLARAVDRIEVVDNYTVRVFTKGVQVYLPYLNGMWTPFQGMVMPKSYLEKNGLDYFRDHPVGTGPFKFTRHVLGDLMEYEANTDYWRGAPAFKTLRMVVMPEETTRLAALRTGEIDAVDITLPNVAQLESAGFKTVTGGMQAAIIHMQGTYYPSAAGMPLANVKVRQALSLAINRDEISKTFFAGKALLGMPSRIPPLADDIDTAFWAKQAAENYLRYDPAAAKQLLTQAGYPNGFDMKLYAFSTRGGEYLPDLAQIVQGYWKKVGVNAQIVPIDEAIFRRMYTAPAPELIGTASLQRASGTPVASTPLFQGYGNAGAYRLFSTSPTTSTMTEIDSLLSQVDAQPDAAKRAQLLQQIIQKTADTYVVVQLNQVPGPLYAYVPRVVEFPRTLPFPVNGFGLIAGMLKKGAG